MLYLLIAVFRFKTKEQKEAILKLLQKLALMKQLMRHLHSKKEQDRTLPA